MAVKHKVFLSYYHKDDEYYRDKFEDLFGDLFINKCVHSGDINIDSSTEYIKRLIREDYISDSSVIVVLVGPKTYCRKHVDWEIYAGLRKKAGLLGLCLPSHRNYGKDSFTPDTDIIPPRLVDNLQSGYAKFADWTENKSYVKELIEDAFNARTKRSSKINNSRLQFVNNRCK